MDIKVNLYVHAHIFVHVHINFNLKSRTVRLSTNNVAKQQM
jgi:hypothetical protein